MTRYTQIPPWARYRFPDPGSVGLALPWSTFYWRSDRLRPYPLVLFIPAIFLASDHLRSRLRFLATGASAALAARYFRATASDRAILPLLIFLASGLCISAVTEALRTTLEKHSEAKAYAKRANDGACPPDQERPGDDHLEPTAAGALEANPAVQAAIASALARIEVVAKVHDELRDTAVNSTVDLAAYLEALCGSLSDFHRGVRSIAIQVSCNDHQ